MKKDTGGTKKDTGTNTDTGGTKKDGPSSGHDQGTQDSGPITPGSIKVAAVQFGPASYQYVSGCSNVNCGLFHFIKKAAQNGAKYIVTPEGATDQGQYAEMDPKVGDKPGSSSKWGSSSVIKTYSALADSLNVTLIYNVITQEGSGTTAKLYNSNVVVDHTGTVKAVHHKYHLYGEKGITKGSSCCDLFDTPAGKAGTLICADIQCVIYVVHGVSSSSCNATGKAMIAAYKASQSRITFFSSLWMATGTSNQYWKPHTVMADFAKYSGTYLVGANTIAGTNNKYKGGGIFRPDGSAIATYNSATPGVVYGVIPKPGGTTPPPTGGKVVITEFMANPAKVADGNGEWFEVYNPGKATVDLNGWKITDTSGKSHTISGSVPVGAGKYTVLGIDKSSATNGGVTVAYDYGSWSLTNSGDQIMLYDVTNKLVDQVSYTSSWGVTSGASLSLKNPSLDNNVSSNWCLEKSPWTGSAGDNGSPGFAANCP